MKAPGFLLVCFVAVLSFSATAAMAQPVTEQSLAAADPMCGALRSCVTAQLPGLDDGKSTPDAVAAKVAPLCEAQQVACNDAIVNAANQRVDQRKMANADQLKTSLAKPEGRVAIDKRISSMVIASQVKIHRYIAVNGMVPPADCKRGVKPQGASLCQ